MRMSHWVESAAPWAEGGETAISAIGDWQWSADNVTWSQDGAKVTLDMRRYPGDAPGVMVDVYPDRRTAVLRTLDSAAEMARYDWPRKVDHWLHPQ